MSIQTMPTSKNLSATLSTMDTKTSGKLKITIEEGWGKFTLSRTISIAADAEKHWLNLFSNWEEMVVSSSEGLGNTKLVVNLNSVKKQLDLSSKESKELDKSIEKHRFKDLLLVLLAAKGTKLIQEGLAKGLTTSRGSKEIEVKM